MAESETVEVIAQARLEAQRLRAAPSSVEAAFMALGDRLRDVHQRTRQLSTMTSVASSDYLGRPAERALSAIESVLERARELRRSAEESLQALGRVDQEIAGVKQRARSFESTVRQLHALCNMIRIENARHAESCGGFATLADDVEALVAEVEARSERLAIESEKLEKLLMASVNRIKRLEADQQDRLHSLVEDSTATLHELRQREQRAAGFLEGVGQQWTMISEGVAGVVMSLQSHDIIRQRVEHVAEVLEQLSPGDPAWDVLQLCRLQAAQLSETRNQAGVAAQSLLAHLESVAAGVSTLAQQAGRECSDIEAPASGATDMLTASLCEITAQLDAYRAMHDQQLQVLEKVRQPVEAMSAFAREIIRLGFTMRILGLNACVQAARVGERGAALSVLAESIHGLSQRTSDDIAEVAERLQRAGRSSTDLSGLAASVATPHADVAALAIDIRSANARARDELQHVVEQATALLDDLRMACSGADLHGPLQASLETSARWLETTAALLETTAERPAGESAALEACLKRYTLQAERDVHQSLVGAAPPPADSGDFDDNIELF